MRSFTVILLFAVMLATRAAATEVPSTAVQFNQQVTDPVSGLTLLLMPMNNAAAAAIMGGTPTEYLIVSVKVDKSDVYLVQVTTKREKSSPQLFTALAYRRYSGIGWASAVFVLPPSQVEHVDVVGISYTTPAARLALPPAGSN